MPTVIPSASATLVGTWSSTGGGAHSYQAESYNFHASGTGSNTASWAFTGLTNGAQYFLALSWVEYSNRGNNVPWTISDGSGVLASGTINQKVAATADFTAGSNSCPFQKLGSAVTLGSGTTLTVQITDNANGFVIADAALSAIVAPPTTATLSGPSGGLVGATSSNFTITLDNAATASVSCVLTASNGATITSTPVTIGVGVQSGTFTITPTAAGPTTVTLTSATTSSTPNSLTIAGSPLVYAQQWIMYRAGNWSTVSGSGSSPWFGGNQTALNTVPGSGDTIEQSFDLTVDANPTTIGKSPNTGDSTPAILFDPTVTGKTLTIAAGITLNCNGDIKLGASSSGISHIVLSAGASLIFKPPSGQQYVIDCTLENADLTCNGSLGSHCAVTTDTSLGGLGGLILSGGGTTHRTQGLLTASYTDFTNWGTTAAFGITTLMETVSGDYSVTHCTFAGCNLYFQAGTLDSWDGNSTFADNYFASSIIRASGYSAGVRLDFAFNRTAGTRLCQRSFFDAGLYLLNKGCQLTDNVIVTSTTAVCTILTGSTWPDETYFAGNCLIRSDSGANTVSMYGSHKNTYLIMNFTGDVHGLNIQAGQATHTITGMIAENTTSGGYGGMILTDAAIASTCAISIKNCLLLPNPDGNAGEFYWNGNLTTNPVLTAEHNTIQSLAGQMGAFGLMEGAASSAGTIASCRGNLIWSATAGSKVWAAEDHSTPATPATNALTTPGAGYNGFWNPTAGTCTINGTPTSTPGYNGFVVTNGSLDNRTHDVTVSGDPFVDKTRNFVVWGTHKGVASSSVANVTTYLANPANGPLDTLLADLRSWVRGGFVVNDSTLAGASYSGDASTVDAAGNAWSGATPDIGAMAYQAPPSPALVGPQFGRESNDVSRPVASGWV